MVKHRNQRKEKKKKKATADKSGRNKSKDISERRKTGSNNISKTRHFKIRKENSANRLVESTPSQISNWRQKKQNNFGIKYGEEKSISGMING